ncbi:hypothetical protein MJH12_17765 [bacterium]|nr:hypothetical protein [bacterium]
MIQIQHLLDQTLKNRVGGVEYINDLLFAQEKSTSCDHQILDADFFSIKEPYSLLDHLRSRPIKQLLSADIIHIHQIQAFGLKTLLDLAKNKKCILTLHDYYLFCQKSTFYRKDKVLCQKAEVLKCTFCNFKNLKSLLLPLFFYQRSTLALDLLKNIKRIVLPNQELFKLIPKEFHHKCLVIHYAVPRIENLTKAPKKNFVYLGTLADHKGIDSLINDLQKIDFQEQLDIYSPNPVASSLPDFVQYKGLMKDKSLLQSYKALIIPSIWKETGPIVLQEALNAGTEVLLYKNSVSKDYQNLNGVHPISSTMQLIQFSPKDFSLDTYHFDQSKLEYERLYQELYKDDA